MRLSTRLTAVGAACALGVLISAPGASAVDQSGGARSCSTSNSFIGVAHKASLVVKTYTNGALRETKTYGSKPVQDYTETTQHSISSWRVNSTGSIVASGTYSYCYTL